MPPEARQTCQNYLHNMKEKQPGQHVHGHRSLHTQAMTRLFLLDFGNPRPRQDLDRPQQTVHKFVTRKRPKVRQHPVSRALFGIEILDWRLRHGSRLKPSGLLVNWLVQPNKLCQPRQSPDLSLPSSQSSTSLGLLFIARRRIIVLKTAQSPSDLSEKSCLPGC